MNQSVSAKKTLGLGSTICVINVNDITDSSTNPGLKCVEDYQEI